MPTLKTITVPPNPSDRLVEGAREVGQEPTPLRVISGRKWSILLFAFAAAGIAALWVSTVPPIFVAEAKLDADTPEMRLMNPDATLFPAESTTEESVQTNMAVLGSMEVAESAATKIPGLTGRREFQECPPLSTADKFHSLWLRLSGQTLPPVPACTSSIEHAAKVLLQQVNFDVQRGTYLVVISASASNPKLAADIANAFAEAYIERQQQSKDSLTQGADNVLTNRLHEQKAKMDAADAAVENYRQEHHLIGLHSGDPSGGVDTLSTEQLEQLNQELSAVSASVTEKRSILAQVRPALNSGRLDAVAPVLGSPVVQSLLNSHAQLMTNLAELRQNFGPSYPAVASAAAALARNELDLKTQSGKVIESLAGEAAALEARRSSLAAQVAALGARVAGQSHDTVKLAELQREAQTERTLYESMSLRLVEIEAERRLEQTNVRPVVAASPPDVAVYPDKPLVIAGSFLASLGVGAGMAFAFELLSRRFRDAAQVENEIGLPVVGVFPQSPNPQDLVNGSRYSIETEALQFVLRLVLGNTAEEGRTGGRAVLVTSALPGEGKSSFCVALGRAASRSGLSAFVVDCDVRYPSIERLISGNDAGENRPLDKIDGDPEAVVAALLSRASVDKLSGLRYLPVAQFVSDPHRLLAWPVLSLLIEQLKASSDLVLIDTPPVLVASDAMQLGACADEVLLMIDWRKTPRSLVNAAVRNLRRARVPATGVVMSKVDLRRYARSINTGGLSLQHYGIYHQRHTDATSS